MNFITKIIAALTIMLALVYVLFKPLEPDPTLPTFDQKRQELQGTAQ